jgi:hypothetical protein
MFPDDDIRETIINYADGAGEENTVIKKLKSKWKEVDKSETKCQPGSHHLVLRRRNYASRLNGLALFKIKLASFFFFFCFFPFLVFFSFDLNNFN